jgi:hypothetical protein
MPSPPPRRCCRRAWWPRCSAGEAAQALQRTRSSMGCCMRARRQAELATADAARCCGRRCGSLHAPRRLMGRHRLRLRRLRREAACGRRPAAAPTDDTRRMQAQRRARRRSPAVCWCSPAQRCSGGAGGARAALQGKAPP